LEYFKCKYGFTRNSNSSVRAILGFNQPYELFEMGYTPYTISNISNNIVVRAYSVSLLPGDETKAAIVPDKSHALFGISGGNPASCNTFSINFSTGVISTTTNTSGYLY
jgi:hypothetical protein